MKILLLGVGNTPILSKFVNNHHENFIKDNNISGHDIKTFGYNNGVDIKINIGDTFQKVMEKLPTDWTPDVCLLWEIENNLLPIGIEQAPFPTVALISDWDYDIVLSKLIIESVDIIVSLSEYEKDSLKAIGANNVVIFHYIGMLKELFNNAPKKIKDRECDILYTTFIDDIHHHERSQWILHLCSLSEKYKVIIETHLPKYKEYISLLGNSKLVFSHHRYGTMSGRVLEAGSQGAVVIDTGTGIKNFFSQDQEYIPVNNKDFADQVEKYLNNSEKLQEISNKFYKKVTTHFESKTRFKEFLNFINSQTSKENQKRKCSTISESERYCHQGELYYYSYFRAATGLFIKDTEGCLLLKSIEAFEKAVALNAIPRTITNLAIAKTSYSFLFESEETATDKINETINILKDVITSFPDYINAHFNLGLIYFQINDFNNALPVLQQTLQLLKTGSSIDPWGLHSRECKVFDITIRKPLNLSLLLLCKGEKDKSLSNIKNIYTATILYLIHTIEIKSGDIYKALDAIIEAHKLYPTSGLIASSAGCILAILGNKKEFIEMYKTALNLLPLSIGLRKQYIETLYAYQMDVEAKNEINNSIKIMQSIEEFKRTIPTFKEHFEDFSKFSDKQKYFYNFSKENIFILWTEILYDCLKRRPTDIRLIFRIIEIWEKLGRSDKIIEILKDYLTHHTNGNINKETLLRIKDVFDKLQKKINILNNTFDSKLINIKNILFS